MDEEHTRQFLQTAATADIQRAVRAADVRILAFEQEIRTVTGRKEELLAKRHLMVTELNRRFLASEREVNDMRRLITLLNDKLKSISTAIETTQEERELREVCSFFVLTISDLVKSG